MIDINNPYDVLNTMFPGEFRREHMNQTLRGRVVVFLDINPLGAVRAAGDEFFEMLGFKPNLAMMNPNVRYPSRVAQFAQGTGFYSEVRCSIFEG